MESSVDIYNILLILWKKKFKIILFVFICTVISIGVSLILPKWYKASAVMMPSENNASFGLNLPSSLSSFGIGSGLVGNNQSFRLLAILNSRSMLEILDEKFDFQHRYKMKYKFETYDLMRKNFSFKLGDQDQLIINLYDRNQDEVADMLNYAITKLDSINIDLSITKAKQNKEFIEKRYLEIQDNISDLENRILTFSTKNNVISINEQVLATINSAAELKARIAAKEIELSVQKNSYNNNSIILDNSEKELFDMKEQYSVFFDTSEDDIFLEINNIPVLSIEFLKLKNELEYYTKIMEYIAPQYEEAKILMIKDLPTIQILDWGIRPEWKAKPKRIIIVIAVFLLSFTIASLYYIIRNKLSK